MSALFFFVILVFVALYGGWQHMKRSYLRYQVHEAAVRQLLELVRTGDIIAFGYRLERYGNKNEWAPLIYVGGTHWEFFLRFGWEHKNSGNIPGEVMAIAYLLSWTDEIDVKDVFDDLATRAGKSDRTFKAIHSIDSRTKQRTLRAKKIQALAA